MKLQWFTTAALLLTEGDRSIAFDPFLGLPPGKRWPALDRGTFSDAAAVFVTHGHFDHILELPALCAGSNAPIYATAAPCGTLRKHGVAPDRLRRIRPGETVAVGPFSITAFQGRHCKFDGPLIRQTVPRLCRHPLRAARLLRYAAAYPEKGEILFYQMTAGGRRIQVMGSLGLDPAVDYPTGADALILPYQGRSDLAEYGWPLVARLRPKAVYLDHYDNSFPPLTAAIDPQPFIDRLTARGIPCRALEPFTTIEL